MKQAIFSMKSSKRWGRNSLKSLRFREGYTEKIKRRKLSRLARRPVHTNTTREQYVHEEQWWRHSNAQGFLKLKRTKLYYISSEREPTWAWDIDLMDDFSTRMSELRSKEQCGRDSTFCEAWANAAKSNERKADKHGERKKVNHMHKTPFASTQTIPALGKFSP